jgi:hypothetical protein
LGTSRRRSRNCFSPTLRGDFCTPWTSITLIASTDAVSAATANSAHEVRPQTSDLFSSKPRRQSLGEALWRRILDCCCPAIHSDHHLVPVLCCLVSVYKLLCIRNKPVLSQPLSLLRVHIAQVLFFILFCCVFNFQ